MKSVAVVGSGPAGLMAAHELLRRGNLVTIFDKQPGPARKLYIAGSSGLNISNGMSAELFWQQYGEPAAYWQSTLLRFGVQQWLQFIHDLGIATFLGTSNRYFVAEMHAAGLIRAWRRHLTESGAKWRLGEQMMDMGVRSRRVAITTTAGKDEFDAVCLALGGGSYERESPAWIEVLRSKGVVVHDFQPSNVGFVVNWTAPFLKEAEGKPLKNVVLTNANGERRGDLVITGYGLEGTPIYTLGAVGTAYLDLKPDLTFEQVLAKLNSVKENLNPLRRAQKTLNISEAAHALIFHMSPAKHESTEELAASIKRFPIELVRPQSLAESISSSGGVAFNEIATNGMLKRMPGVFVAGEMLDWTAPTGGFLIQGCVSQGYCAGVDIADYVASLTV